MATFASVGGVELPTQDRAGQPIIFDSYDMSPVLFGTGKSPRTEWFYFTENELSPGAARVGNYKAVFNLRGDDGASTGGLAVDTNLGWKGAEKYVATVPQVFDLWQDPQERYDIFMNNYTERTWTMVTISEAIKKLMKTYVQYPPRKLQSEAYTGPITISDYEKFQNVREMLAKEGVTIADADRQLMLHDAAPDTPGAALLRHRPGRNWPARVRPFGQSIAKAAGGSIMRTIARRPLLIASLGFGLAIWMPHGACAQTDPLPSWNDGATKHPSPISSRASPRRAGRTSCRPDQRIATFDNDGTLWVEQPMYVQLAFILDRVKALAPQNPEWATTQPFKAVLDGDMQALAASGEKGLMELMAATHAGMTTDEFAKIAADWLASARDHRFKRPYTELVYQPMLELLAYLRANGFKTFIVSGGGIEFMRPWAEKVYGIPPEQVVGSSIKTKFEMRDGKPVLFRLPEVEFHRRQGRQARRHQRAHRPAADRRVRQLRRRPRDAAVDHGGRRRALRSDRPSHRCRARIRLRPPVPLRQARQGAGRRRGQQVDRG